MVGETPSSTSGSSTDAPAGAPDAASAAPDAAPVAPGVAPVADAAPAAAPLTLTADEQTRLDDAARAAAPDAPAGAPDAADASAAEAATEVHATATAAEHEASRAARTDLARDVLDEVSPPTKALIEALRVGADFIRTDFKARLVIGAGRRAIRKARKYEIKQKEDKLPEHEAVLVALEAFRAVRLKEAKKDYGEAIALLTGQKTILETTLAKYRGEEKIDAIFKAYDAKITELTPKAEAETAAAAAEAAAAAPFTLDASDQTRLDTAKEADRAALKALTDKIDAVEAHFKAEIAKLDPGVRNHKKTKVAVAKAEVTFATLRRHLLASGRLMEQGKYAEATAQFGEAKDFITTELQASIDGLDPSKVPGSHNIAIIKGLKTHLTTIKDTELPVLFTAREASLVALTALGTEFGTRYGTTELAAHLETTGKAAVDAITALEGQAEVDEAALQAAQTALEAENEGMIADAWDAIQKGMALMERNPLGGLAMIALAALSGIKAYFSLAPDTQMGELTQMLERWAGGAETGKQTMEGLLDSLSIKGPRRRILAEVKVQDLVWYKTNKEGKTTDALTSPEQGIIDALDRFEQGQGPQYASLMASLERNGLDEAFVTDDEHENMTLSEFVESREEWQEAPA